MITKRYLFVSLLVVVLLLRFRCEGHLLEPNPLIRSSVIDGQTGNRSHKIYSHKEGLTDLSFDNETDEELFRPRQKEAGIMIAWRIYKRSSSGLEKAEALEKIRRALSKRAHIDGQIEMIGTLLYGSESAHSILYPDRDIGIYNYDCIRSTSRLFEKYCGLLTPYGMKHLSTFSNICNYSVDTEVFEKVCIDTCGEKIMTMVHSI